MSGHVQVNDQGIRRKRLVFSRLWFVVALILYGPMVLTASDSVPVAVRIEREGFVPLTLEFSAPPTLAQLLEEVPVATRVYWPNARLFQLDSVAPENQKQAVLVQLEALQQYWENRGRPARAKTIQALQKQVVSWRVARAIAIRLDYDLARIQPKYSPRMDPGSYLLRCGGRPATVALWGAIAPPREIPHLNATAADRYLEWIALLPGADHSWLYSIPPYTPLERIPVASWNRHHQEVMPGSQLFLPVHEALLPPGYRSLNLALAELLRHRVSE